MSKTTKIIISLVVIVLLVWVWWYVANRKNLATNPDMKVVETVPVENKSIPPVATSEIKASESARSETTQWKIYTNTASGFEIEYPANWYVWEEWEKDGRVSFSDFKDPNAAGANIWSYFTITSRGTGKKLSLEDWFEEEVNFAELGLESKEPVTINGLAALKIKLVPARSSWVYYYVVHGTDFIEIGFIPKEENSRQRYEHMLSTFKFIK